MASLWIDERDIKFQLHEVFNIHNAVPVTFFNLHEIVTKNAAIL